MSARRNDVAGRLGPWAFGGLLLWDSVALAGRDAWTEALMAGCMGALIVWRLGRS